MILFCCSWIISAITFWIRSNPIYNTQDLKNIFDNLKDKITSIHSDVGNTWFITFADEDSTTDAFLLSRGKQFQNKPVQARVKSENLLKSV